jgi:mono/diheme cytochrome c family protein
MRHFVFTALLSGCLGVMEPDTGPAGGGDEIGTGGGTASSGGGMASSGGGTASSGAPAAYQAHCAVCHGMNAEGTDLVSGGPELQHVNGALLTYFARHGDDNTFEDMPAGVFPVQTQIGDQRTMTAFSTTAVTNAELEAIRVWSDALPRATDGQALYVDFCAYCHGPTVPNAVNDPVNHPRGAYYAKPGITMADLDWASFATHVRSGVNPTLDPSHRRRYMPPFDTVLLPDAELSLIAKAICAQYPPSVTVTATSFCQHVP